MGRGISRFNIGEKLAIIDEAFARPGGLFQTGKKYGVDWRNIKRWKKTLCGSAELDRRAKIYRPLSSVQTVVEGHDVWNHLRQYIETLRERDHAVTGTMLFHEVRR